MAGPLLARKGRAPARALYKYTQRNPFRSAAQQTEGILQMRKPLVSIEVKIDLVACILLAILIYQHLF